MDNDSKDASSSAAARTTGGGSMAADPSRRRGRSAAMARLPTAIAHGLSFGVLASLVVAVVQTALLFTGSSAVVFNTGFVIFNLLAQCWASFAFFFVMSYGPSPLYIRVVDVAAGVLSMLLGVWLYFYFADNSLSRVGLLVVYVHQALCYMLLGVFAPAGQYKLMASKPHQPESFGVFFSVLRMAFIVLVPMLAKYTSDGRASLASFFAAALFMSTASIFAANIRLSLSMARRASTLYGLLIRMSLRDFVLGFGYLIGNLFCFLLFYIIEFSSLTAPDSLLFVLFLLSTTLSALGFWSSFATVTQWRALAFMSAIQPARLRARRNDSMDNTANATVTAMSSDSVHDGASDHPPDSPAQS